MTRGRSRSRAPLVFALVGALVLSALALLVCGGLVLFSPDDAAAPPPQPTTAQPNPTPVMMPMQPVGPTTPATPTMPATPTAVPGQDGVVILDE